MRTYIFSDILKRTLLYNNYKVKHVMNVTDVGHLTSDADEGEDKMENAARKEGKTAKDIANFYLKAFKDDFKKLNIIEPEIWCNATDHIKEQIELIKILERKGCTYRTPDGIYFDTSKIDDYGMLARINIKGLEAGKRISMKDKRNSTDFALWKFSEKPGLRQQEWKSPWSEAGFPGWHIECSAMSSKYLGKQFDIHTGGEDHIAIHHTNEIAQSETAFGKKPWVRYWLHGSFLTFKGEKVSKSKGGLHTISELEALGYGALDYRYLCLLTHYRKQLDFSLNSLSSAKNAFNRLKDKVIELRKNKGAGRGHDNRYKNDFIKAIDDDLNMPRALGIMWEMLKDDNLESKEKLDLLFDFDKVLGLSLKDVKEEKIGLADDIEMLIRKREDARKNNDFKTADKIRDELRQRGIILEDKSDGLKIKKLNDAK